MKKTVNILAIFCALSAYSQEPTFVFEDTVNNDTRIRFTSYNSYASNRFNNDLMDKFLFGGEITSEIKDRSSSTLKLSNVIGGEFEQRIDSYTPDVNLFKKEEYGLKLSFSDNHFVAGQISKDLFNTALYGNGNSLGDTMNFTYSSFQYIHYQKFGVGFYHQNNMSSIQLSYIAGSKTIEAALLESWMHTTESGDSIEFYLNGNGFATERFYPYWAFQGSGFSADIDYNFIFEGKVKNRQVVNLKINNIGFIVWNKKSANYNMNLSDVYTGFDIQDILTADTSTFSDINWQDTLGINTNTTRSLQLLPMEIVVQKVADRGIDAKLQAIFGFKAILIPNYFPYLYVGAYYQPTKDLGLSTRLSYGGFAGLRWGLNVNYWLKERLYFSAGSFDIIGLTSKKIGYGRGFNFSMYYNF